MCLDYNTEKEEKLKIVFYQLREGCEVKHCNLRLESVAAF